MGTRIQRLVQADQVRYVIRVLAGLLDAARRDLGDYQVLESVSLGLYEEMDKLCRSGPDVPITEKAMGEVNFVLEDAARLMRADPYISRFVRPFDTLRGVPPHRDTVLALRQVRLGLERYISVLDARLDTLGSRQAQAEAIRGALEIAAPLSDGAVLRRDLEGRGWQAHPDWFRDFSYNLSEFDFLKLNATDILAYFLADL